MHRGPQANMIAAPTAAPAGFQPAPFHHAPNAALLIDFDNVTMGIRSDLGHELRNLLSSDIIKGKVAVQRAYADWRRYPQYIVPLAESSIDMIMAPAYGSSKKNATDIRLAVDAIELVFTRPEIDTFILLSGDSDFASLVTKLKEYSKYVIGVGIRESSSDLLVMNCNEYYSYNALAGLVKSGDEETTKRDPWELVLEAVQRMKRNGDVMRSDRLKQVMQEIDNSFDEGNLGMAKFSRFCQEAAAKGLLKISRLENGQMEIDVPDGTPSLPQSPSVLPSSERRVATAAGTPENRRRGRRGGRGRGRDREENGAPRPEMSETAPELVPDAAPEFDLEPREVAIEARVPSPESRAVDAEMTGMRLSRDEAFTLIRRAVESLSSGPDDSVSASRVRAKARELLGRDSETLSERHFHRILRDMHDAEQIDLRKRGDDYEVSPSPDAPPIAEQLAASEAVAVAAADASQAGRSASNAASLRRGIRGRGRGRGGAGELPPELRNLGVIENGTPPVADVPPVDDADEADDDAPAPAAVAGEKAPVKRRRGIRGGRARKKKEPGAE
jgi:uncharacterized protein (TIGR00288 family)